MSIIIPCHNDGAYVRQAIESALGQTYSNIEVIVVDDGSVDNSWDVISAFEGRITCVTGPNRGGCAARNWGLELARGEWIQFLDADDLLYADKLAIQLPLALAHGDAVTYTDHFCSQLYGDQPPEYRSRPMTDSDPFVFVLQHRSLTITAPLYRKRWLHQVGGFRDGLRACQEFDLHLRLALRVWPRDGFIHVNQGLFEVRRRASSVSSNPARTFAVAATFLPEIAKEICGEDACSRHRRTALAVYAAGIGRQCLRGNELSAGGILIELADRLDRLAAEARVWGTAARFVKRSLGYRMAEILAHWNPPTVLRRTVGRLKSMRYAKR